MRAGGWLQCEPGEGETTWVRDMKRKLGWLLLVLIPCAARPLPAAKVTIDDLMRLRSISDVRISPDGKRIAYVVSTPSFEEAEHVPVLYVVPATGGAPLRLTYKTRIFNRRLPAAWLRWSPDGSLLSFVGFVDGVPQVMAMSSTGGEPWPLTSVKEGVTRYEWAPDGSQIAFLAPDPTPTDRKSTRLNSSHIQKSRMPSSA